MRVFTIEFPPSTNTCYVNAQKGRHLTEKGRSYKTRIQYSFMGNEPTEDYYSVSIHLFPPTKAKRDCGNYEKLICDAMSGFIYEDDSQIKHLQIFMHHKDKENPRAEVTVDVIKW